MIDQVMKSEVDFKFRVNAGEWPETMKHGQYDNGSYDYRVVIVIWKTGEDKYLFEPRDEFDELDGGRDRFGVQRSAFERADRILRNKAIMG